MLKNLNKMVIYVHDLAKTAEFYSKLGFTVTTSEAVVYLELNGFSIEAVVGPTEEGMQGTNDAIQNIPKGIGIFFLIEVTAVDQYHADLLAKEIPVSTEPKTWGWGRREFVVRDPDGYKLVFYSKVT